MVSHFHKSLSKLEGVDDHQLIVEVKWDLKVVRLDVFVCVKKNIMSILVISKLLLLLSYINCNFNSLLDVSDSPVKFKGPLWLLWDVVSFTHQVINELMSERIDFGFAHHLDHIWNGCLSLRNIQLKSFLVILTLFVVFSGFAPL